MFGYVTPMACELKVRENELYKAYYCGLCKVLKQKYHKSAALNYDCTFLYLLGDSLQHGETDVQPCACGFHPVQKRSKVVADAAEYAADVNVLMAYAKLRDDAYDTGSVTSKLRLPSYNRAFAKARRSVPEMARKTLETETELRRLEQAKSANTDEVAEPYAKLFGGLLQELDVTQSHILYDLGYAIGRWVYLVDACDDIEKDSKGGEYNVFVNKYGLTGAMPDDVKNEVEFNFNFTLSQAMDALSRLELKKNRGILQNIVCLGLKERTKQVLYGRTDESIPGPGR